MVDNERSSLVKVSKNELFTIPVDINSIKYFGIMPTGRGGVPGYGIAFFELVDEEKDEGYFICPSERAMKDPSQATLHFSVGTFLFPLDFTGIINSTCIITLIEVLTGKKACEMPVSKKNQWKYFELKR